jgi:hypothetical protein
MKTNSRAWRLYRARIWAGLGLLFVLALAGFGNVFRFDRDCGRTVGQPQPVNEIYELADLPGR